VFRILKYGSRIAGEIRKADFLTAFDREVEVTRIVPFGACNFHCAYCKRDAQFVDGDGNIIRSVSVDWADLKKVIDEAISKGERIRLSGGDPVMFPKESQYIAEYVYGEHGKKISMAHNGSSLRFAKMMAPYLEYAAIDLKGATPKELAYRAGLPSEASGEIMLKSTLEVQDYLSEAGVIVDVRTPVFGDTPLDHLFKMAEMIQVGGDSTKEFWTLRKYNPIRACDWVEPRGETLSEWARLVSKENPNLPIGLREKWTGQKGFKILKGGKEI